MIKAIANKVIEYRLIILVITVVISSLAAYFAITGVTLRASLNEMLPSNHKNVLLYEEFSDKFGGVNTVLVMVKNKNGSVYEKEFLEKYKKNEITRTESAKIEIIFGSSCLTSPSKIGRPTIDNLTVPS